jgi:energy-coupling factor transport system ATP-binding protein
MELKTLKNEGKTLIIAEHRCHYLKDIADRIVIMDHGRIADIYSKEQFYQFTNQEMNSRGLRWIHEGSGELKAAASRKLNAEIELSARELCFQYPDRSEGVLDGVSFSANGGEIIGLTGPNGSGKTTLAMLLCGLFRECGGQITIHGRPLKPKERMLLCRLVLQEADHQLFAESAFRELELALPSGTAHNRIMAALEAVGLTEKAHCRSQSLSGGEKQRLAVAAALIAEPEVLILDESTSGLDAGNMKRLRTLLEGAASQGTLIIIVTHDVEFIRTCCTRTIHLEKGELHDGKTSHYQIKN